MIQILTNARTRIAYSPLARRFLGGAAWSVAGAVVSSGITLVSMMFVARLLGKETYGQFVVVQSTLGMAGVFAGFGIGAVAIRYVAELRSRDASRLTHILSLTERTVLFFGLIATVVLALNSGIIASAVLNSPGLSLPLSIAAFSVFFSALDGYQKSVLIGLEAMRSYAIGTIVGAAVSVPVILMSADMYGLNGVAGAMVVNAIIQASISRFQMVGQLQRFAIRREARGCMSEWRVLRDFALPALLAGVLVVPANWICQAMLANTPSGYSELAVLGVAMQWFNVILFLPNVAGRVVLPVLTERLAAGDNKQAAKVLKLAILANLAVAVPVSLVISLASPWIMAAYGSQFRNGWQTLALVAVVAILVVGTTPVGQVLAAGNRMWLGAAMNFGWVAILLGAALFLVRYGAIGVALSLCVAYLVHSIWVGFYAIRHIADLNVNKKITDSIFLIE